MSDAPRIFGSIPTGRRLEQPDYDPNYQGTIGPLRRADEARLRLARRSLREIAAKDVEGDGKYLTDTTTGEELEVITSFVDLVDVKQNGATAFTIRFAARSAAAEGVEARGGERLRRHDRGPRGKAKRSHAPLGDLLKWAGDSGITTQRSCG